VTSAAAIVVETLKVVESTILTDPPLVSSGLTFESSKENESGPDEEQDVISRNTAAAESILPTHLQGKCTARSRVHLQMPKHRYIPETMCKPMKDKPRQITDAEDRHLQLEVLLEDYKKTFCQ
jgi:hypothetical protein